MEGIYLWPDSLDKGVEASEHMVNSGDWEWLWRIRVGRSGVIVPWPGTRTQDKNIEGLVCCAKAWEVYLEGSREPLEDLSTRVTPSDLSVSLISQLIIYCCSAPKVPCMQLAMPNGHQLPLAPLCPNSMAKSNNHPCSCSFHKRLLWDSRLWIFACLAPHEPWPHPCWQARGSSAPSWVICRRGSGCSLC